MINSGRQTDFKNSTLCIILAAGRSQRMQKHKALLEFSERESFIAHLINEYKKAEIHNICLVLNPEVALGFNNVWDNKLSIISNNSPEKGRLHSIRMALKAFPKMEFYFIQNVDNPFVTQSVISSLINGYTKGDYTTPVQNGVGLHPIVISNKVAQHIISCTDEEITLREILQQFNRNKIHVSETNLAANINTKEDYQTYFNKVPLGRQECGLDWC